VGRQLALIAMAVYADQDAVAQSNRCWHTVSCDGPWAVEVPELLDELVSEKLPASILTLLGPVLEQRREVREQQAATRRAREEALARLEGAEERIAELDADALEQVTRDLEQAWNGWDERLLLCQGTLAICGVLGAGVAHVMQTIGLGAAVIS
jgi:hypothetical protein